MILLVLSTILLSILLAKPVFVKQPLLSHNYLSRERTCCINGIFIWLVFIGHLNHYPISFLEAEKSLNAEICQLSQLVVTTFFFYSGYGIMHSLISKGKDYAKALLFSRFPRLLCLFASTVLLFWLIESLMGRTYEIPRVLVSLIGLDTLENSGWFVFITLLSYLEIGVAYFCFSKYGNTIVSLMVALLMCIQMPILETPIMNDTLLCIPAGMLLCVYRERIDSFITRIPVHAGILGILLAITGRYVYYFNALVMLPPEHSTSALILYYLVDNIGGIMFALGVTWIFAAFSFKQTPRFLLWSGGIALFYLYILQRIPMMLGVYWGINSSQPTLYNVACMIITILLASAFIHVPRYITQIATKRLKA